MLNEVFVSSFSPVRFNYWSKWGIESRSEKKINIFLHGLPYANTIFVNTLKRGINPEENISVD